MKLDDDLEGEIEQNEDNINAAIINIDKALKRLTVESGRQCQLGSSLSPSRSNKNEDLINTQNPLPISETN